MTIEFSVLELTILILAIEKCEESEESEIAIAILQSLTNKLSTSK